MQYDLIRSFTNNTEEFSKIVKIFILPVQVNQCMILTEQSVSISIFNFRCLLNKKLIFSMKVNRWSETKQRISCPFTDKNVSVIKQENLELIKKKNRQLKLD